MKQMEQKRYFLYGKKHFYDIFNCIKNEGKIRTPNNIVEEANKISVDHQTVKEAIKDLSINKSCGMDGITAEHLKYASERLIYLLLYYDHRFTFPNLFLKRFNYILLLRSEK